MSIKKIWYIVIGVLIILFMGFYVLSQKTFSIKNSTNIDISNLRVYGIKESRDVYEFDIEDKTIKKGEKIFIKNALSNNFNSGLSYNVLYLEFFDENNEKITRELSLDYDFTINEINFDLFNEDDGNISYSSGKRFKLFN
ncbi:MAG: hypothetical protein ACRCZK_00345 [Oscillospiraceae bacterium]